MNGMCFPIPCRPVWVELSRGAGVEQGQGLCVCCRVCPRCGNVPRGVGEVISTLQVDEKAHGVENCQVSAKSCLECL